MSWFDRVVPYQVYDPDVTWVEVIRKLRTAGFVQVRSGRGSHLLLKHSTTDKEVWLAGVE